MNILENRIEAVEELIYSHGCAEPVRERFESLNERVEEVYREVPDLQSNLDLCSELSESIRRKKGILVNVGELIQSILAQKEELLISFRFLENIDILKPVINSSALQDDYSTLEGRLSDLQVMIYTLCSEHEKQTLELNNMLNVYDDMVSLLSKKSVEWDMMLVEFEK
jgi:hypothetical protein